MQIHNQMKIVKKLDKVFLIVLFKRVKVVFTDELKIMFLNHGFSYEI